MLTKKQYRMLELLSDMIESCKDCGLWTGGCCPPYFTPKSKYLIIGEAPGKDEITEEQPFVGKAGKILWNIMDEYNLKKSRFAIINSVCCRPIKGDDRNGKPTESQILECNQWLKKLIIILEPRNILCLGNSALWIFERRYGITEYNGIHRKLKNTTITYSVHPAYAIYNKEIGLKYLKKGIRKFKEEIDKNG